MQVTCVLREDPVHDEGELRARGRRDLVHDGVLAVLAAPHGAHARGGRVGDARVTGPEDEVAEVVVVAPDLQMPRLCSLVFESQIVV